MSNTSVSTSVDDLLKIIRKADSNPEVFKSIVNALTKTMPVKRRKAMTDENLDKTFYINRVNYSVVAKIEGMSKATGCYKAKIVSIEKGETNIVAGDTVLISKKELELTGHPTHSVE